MPSTPEPSAEAAFNRALNASDKLFVALEDLDQSGGLVKLRGRMRPASVDRAAELLRSVRLAIDEQLEALDRPEPGRLRRTLLRRQANRPETIRTAT